MVDDVHRQIRGDGRVVDGAVHDPVVRGRDHERTIIDVCGFERPQCDRTVGRLYEGAQCVFDLGGDDAESCACAGERLALPQCDLTTAHEEALATGDAIEDREEVQRAPSPGPSQAGPMTSRPPMNGRSASGTTTLPSCCW